MARPEFVLWDLGSAGSFPSYPGDFVRFCRLPFHLGTNQLPGGSLPASRGFHRLQSRPDLAVRPRGVGFPPDGVPAAPGDSYHAPSAPPPSPIRPPTPPTADHAGVAPTSSVVAIKRKRQGSHLVQAGVAGARPPSFGPASVPPIKAMGGRKKTPSTGPAGARAKTPRRKVLATRGWAPPPPPVGHGIHIPGDFAGYTYHVFDEMTGSQSVPSKYTEMLAESEVDLSALLSDFDATHVEVDQENDDDDDLQVIDEADYDARTGWTDNYMEMEDVCLVQSWESISLDAVVGKDQSYGCYWQRIKDKYHQMMPFPSGRSLKSLQGRWDTINKCCILEWMLGASAECTTKWRHY